MRPSYLRRKAAGICTACGRTPAHPGRIDCDACRFRRAQQYDVLLTRDRWDQQEARRTARRTAHCVPVPMLPLDDTGPLALKRIPSPALMHCGQAWPITPGQVRCGACGTTYTQEAPSHA